MVMGILQFPLSCWFANASRALTLRPFTSDGIVTHVIHVWLHVFHRHCVGQTYFFLGRWYCQYGLCTHHHGAGNIYCPRGPKFRGSRFLRKLVVKPYATAYIFLAKGTCTVGNCTPYFFSFFGFQWIFTIDKLAHQSWARKGSYHQKKTNSKENNNNNKEN